MQPPRRAAAAAAAASSHESRAAARGRRRPSPAVPGPRGRRRGPLAAPDWLCLGRQWPQPLLLLPPARCVMARLLSAPTPAVLLLIALQLWSTKSQYAYHSASPYGPWKPVQVVAAGTAAGLTLPPGDIWYGPHCATKAANSSSLDPLSCGGNNPSPYFIDHEAAAATGFAPGTVIIGTTWSANQSYDGEPSRRRSSISVGICRNWSSACDIHPQTLFHFPHQNEWQNFSAIDKEGKYTQEVWNAWGYEDPFIYWDKHLQRWRALFHQYRKSGLRGGGAVGTWPSKGASTDPNIMSGGYAISKTTQLFGAWTIYPPSYGVC
jgi:hypothetical protein